MKSKKQADALILHHNQVDHLCDNTAGECIEESPSHYHWNENETQLKECRRHHLEQNGDTHTKLNPFPGSHTHSPERGKREPQLQLNQ